MNKFWLYIKKTFVTFTLVLSLSAFSLLSGCFLGGEDGDGSLSDVLYGIRMTYQKAIVDKQGNYTSSHDEDFVNDLVVQYMNISCELLVSLSAQFGKGINSFNDIRGMVNGNLSAEFASSIKNDDFGDPNSLITIDEIPYSDNYTAPYENMICNEDQPWTWAQELAGSSLSKDRFASEFCSPENMFKLQIAMYLINMGKDCSAENYGDFADSFNESNTIDTLVKYASDVRISHSGLLEVEQEMLVDFILNNVIGSADYRSQVKDIVTMLANQTEGTSPDGKDILKYPIVASVMVKDYYIKDIALMKDGMDIDSEESEEDGEDSQGFFTMELGQQYYKSMVFMAKDKFKFSGLSLIFQSTEDVLLKVYARIHEENSDELYLNAMIAEIPIQAGLYEEIEDSKANLDISMESLLQENLGTNEPYYLTKYNQETDVKCYGGLLGSGVGDGLFDKFGRALSIAKDGDDLTLANLYSVTKESKDSSGVISFEKNDSSYFELVFETDSNKPFNIGFLLFDYEITEE